MTDSPKESPLFACLECGRGFRTTRAAERAAWNGCPGCGGSDIDLATRIERDSARAAEAALAAGASDAEIERAALEAAEIALENLEL